jgi:phenylalanyl-tRNA synthetase beta chain
VVLAGEAPAAPASFDFDPAYVAQLSGPVHRASPHPGDPDALGFGLQDGGPIRARAAAELAPRRGGQGGPGREVARIQGYGALPSTPLPPVDPKPGGVLTPLQARARAARRALAAAGYQEAVTWSFTARDKARLFEGGGDDLIVANPIASDLDCMRPSALPNLIEAAGRSAARGFPDAALFEIGPLYLDATERGQKLAATAVVAAPPARRWDGGTADPLFVLKADLQALLLELGAPTASLQVVQGEASSWWHPGRSAQVKLGPKTTLASSASCIRACSRRWASPALSTASSCCWAPSPSRAERAARPGPRPSSRRSSPCRATSPLWWRPTVRPGTWSAPPPRPTRP